MDTLKWALNIKKNSREPLLRVFFDPVNFKFLGDLVAAAVTKSSGIQIAPQEPMSMAHLMMRVYDDFNRSGAGLKRNLGLINTRFVALATKHILAGINDYKHYYKAASTLPIPISRSQNASMKGDKILRTANKVFL